MAKFCKHSFMDKVSTHLVEEKQSKRGIYKYKRPSTWNGTQPGFSRNQNYKSDCLLALRFKKVLKEREKTLLEIASERFNFKNLNL
jgi:hypothetical protein